MNIIVVDNYDQMSSEVARIVKEQIEAKNGSVLGLATGGTPLGVYGLLAEYYRNGLDFGQVTTFNLDEYVGLSPSHPTSYHYYMQENLFSKVNLDRENTFIPNGTAPDLEEECKRYEQLIKQRGGIDLQLLGIGVNGHIGFNEPGTPFGSQTQVVDLAESTIKANARFFTSEKEVPTQAVSLGIKNIMQAHNIVLLANGALKAEAIRAALQGPVSVDLPASVLQLHPSVIFVVDQAAAAQLQ